MDKLIFDEHEFDIPNIAVGKTVPDIVRRTKVAEAKARKAERKTKLYFWLGIFATFAGTVVGWLLGKYA